MPEIKVFKLKKTTPNDVIFVLHPLSNQALSKTVVLTERNPYQMLPLDWALGMFIDDGLYSLYKNGYVTFDENEELVKAAYENGAYFSDVLDFVPSKEENLDKIFKVLQSGNRSAIMDVIKEYGNDSVKNVAIKNANNLSVGVVNMLEQIFKCQLIIDGETSEELN